MAITINVNLDEILAALKNDLDFTGNANKYIKVNATADGFEFAAVSAPTWGAITGTLSSQTDLQSALDLKANLSGAAFTGDVSVTTSGSGDTLQLTNSGSGTTLNILNSGSGDFFAIDTNKLVVSNNGNLAVDTDTLVVDAVNNRVGIGTATPLYNLDLDGGNVTGVSNIFSSQRVYSTTYNKNYSIAFQQYYNSTSISLGNGAYSAGIDLADSNLSLITQNVGSIALNGGRGTQITNQLSPTTVGAVLKVLCATTDSVGAIIQAAAGQTANLLEVKNSGGTNLFEIAASGGIKTNGNAGFTGTGSYTNFTIENGIITAAS